jgi:hypothetical protein
MATILKAKDFIGKSFHYLTVVSDVGLRKVGSQGLYSVLCVCKCGKTKVCSLSELKAGRKGSCGCYRQENSKKMFEKHGIAKHPLYSVWFQMISRCTKPSHPKYLDYGGRGITVCDEWKNNVTVFYDWAMANGWKKGLENDRIDNNGNYEPSNCRFVTRRINCRNKRDNRIIEYKGKSKTFIEWSEYLGLSRGILKDRINKLKWPIEKAFTTPKLYAKDRASWTSAN